MKTDNLGDPLYPTHEAETCLFFRRNHDILLGPLSSLLFHARFVGHYICREDYHINRQMEGSALLLLTLAGEGEFRFRNSRTTLKRGSCFLIDTQFHHEYFPVKEGWEFKYLHFWGGDTPELLAYMEPHGPVFTLDEGELGHAEAILDRILDDTEEEAIEDYPALSGEIYSLIMFLIAHDRKKTEKKKRDAADAMARVIEYIRGNYKKNIGAREIARSVSMSRSALFELFEITYGMPPHEYLIQYRLSLAKDMLVNTSLSVTEIAEQSGFKDIFAFSRRFKDKTGMSPSEYRRQNSVRIMEPPRYTHN